MPPSPDALWTTRKPCVELAAAPAEVATGSARSTALVQMSRIRRICAPRVLRSERNVRPLREPAAMASDPLQSRADALAARIEALAAALRASGVSAETSERLLSQASAAALQALTLELLLEQADPPDEAGVGPLLEPEGRQASRFRVAA